MRVVEWILIDASVIRACSIDMEFTGRCDSFIYVCMCPFNMFLLKKKREKERERERIGRNIFATTKRASNIKPVDSAQNPLIVDFASTFHESAIRPLAFVHLAV